MKKSFRLNRRALLRGLGVALPLPLLEAMLPGTQSAFALSDLPTRLLAYYVPNGIYRPAWTPAETGRSFSLPATLEPLAQVKDDLLVLGNLANRPAQAESAGDHSTGTGSFITATHVRKTEGDDIYNGVSIDQVVAQRIGHLTPLPSLQLGMDSGGSAGVCDGGYACAYVRNISWSGPQTPVPKLTDPQQVLDRLFGSFGITGKNRPVATNQSLLDYVLSDIHKLQKKLGSTDRKKLDEYLTGVEQLERKLSVTPSTHCAIPHRPEETQDLTAKAQIMSDLIVLAFQCDMTRAVTFMLANGGSWRSYDFLGVDSSHHQASHHQGLQSNFEKLKIIENWEVQQFAYLLEKLKGTRDIQERPLLDSCTAFFSSEIADGSRHNHVDLPVLLAGKANGYFATGRHVRYDAEQPIANLFMTMLDAMGIPVDQFGEDGTEILHNLQIG